MATATTRHASLRRSSPRGTARERPTSDDASRDVPGFGSLGDGARGERAWLSATKGPARLTSPLGLLRVVDLFAGCGGLSLGVREACRSLGYEFDCRLALDSHAAAAAVYNVNFPGSRVVVQDVKGLLDGAVGQRATPVEQELRRSTGSVDVLIGGPPCQGHSDLNNWTRRQDSKNELYLRMVRAAEVLRPRAILVENVPGALNDRGRVVDISRERLEKLGYRTDIHVADTSTLGVAQTRRRLLLVAYDNDFSLAEALERHRTSHRTVRWAIGDLKSVTSADVFDAPTRSAAATKRRISYLFDNGLYDLPNSERPACHAGGGHSYSSVYGRLSWDKPAQTITTGFYCMCMGRYVHPSQRRTITAHEAARLQFFPDWFDFSGVQRRGDLATMIGNAVPPKLSYVVMIELLKDMMRCKS
jgi:DNA (cytosine-5)-methyltransferase 1